MKINIKTLKGEVITLQIDPTKNIADLKQLIKNQRGIPTQSQKIIFKGKTTTNEDIIQKLGVKQTDFLVVMNQIAKPQPKTKVEEKIQEPKPMQEQKKQVKEEKKEVNKTSQNPNQAQINQLMSMGFPREQCVAALKAAYNNSQRAVQFLLNGIPSNQNQNQGQLNANSLQLLASLPQFEAMRQAIQTDPSSIQTVVQQLATTQPQIYNLIMQHPQQFQRLLLGGEDDEDFDEQEQGEGLGEGEGEEGQIIITQQQQQAINRLSNLGFSKLQAAQAYMACDKNEQMAANLLFDRLANGDIEQSNENIGDQDDDLFN